MRRKNPNDKILRPVHPCCGLEAIYRRKLYGLIEEMQASVEYWLRAAFNANPPILARDSMMDLDGRRSGSEFQRTDASVHGALDHIDRELHLEVVEGAVSFDALPVSELRDAIRKLIRRWQRRFNWAAPKLAEWFAQAQADRSDGQLRSILRKGGFSVKFKLTRAQRDVLNSIVHANVSLIKSIPQQYLRQVEAHVMESVQTGRDFAPLYKALRMQFGVTKRRAALITRDQSNKATAALTRVRHLELGITKAIWLHSGGGRHPRPSHVRNSGREYDVHKGWLDPAINKRIWPGTEINCLPGDSVVEFSAGCKKLWRRWYTGELSLLIMSSDKVVKATPNHPVLTDRGWIPIKSVGVGDYVISAGEQCFDRFKEHIDSYNATISQIFDTTSSYIALDAAPKSLAKFHGDISEHEVDVVDIDGFLPSVLDPASCKNFSEFFFPYAYHVLIRAGLNLDSSLYLSGLRLFSAPHSVIRGFSIFLPFLQRCLLSPEQVSLGLVSELNALLDKPPIDCASVCSVLFSENVGACSDDVFSGNLLIGKLFGVLSRAAISWNYDVPCDEMPLDSLAVGANAGSSMFHRHSFFKKADRVVDKGRIQFSGHVFNLENAFNWYTSQSYILHNCRCVSKPIVQGFS